MKYHITIHSDPTMTKCWLCEQIKAESDMTVYIVKQIRTHNHGLFPCCSDCVMSKIMERYGHTDRISHQEAQLLLIKSKL